MSKTYRTTLILNPNHPDKAAALDWLNHLQKEHPEKSISDIVGDLLNEDRSRVQGENDLASAMSGLTASVKELTEVVCRIANQGITQPQPTKPVEPERLDAEEANKMLNMFGF